MIHGGEIYGRPKIKYDFSVNINPLGIPEGVRGRLRDHFAMLEQYPDPNCGELRAALERSTGIPAGQILCGNGASELIEAAVRAVRPRRILLTAPSFSGYRHAAEGAGAEIRYHRLLREENFDLTQRYLEDLTSGTDMAILCSPANPVGNLIDHALLMQIVEDCERRGIWLMVDECFLGFVTDGEERTMRRLLAADGEERPKRLMVLDAFTKRFAMPGIRLGYLMAQDPEILQKVHAQQPEWSVSVPAQIAGLAALETERAYMESARGLVISERRRMAQALSSLGFAVFPGEAGYLFFSSETELFEPLLSRGFLIRRCDNYEGLERGDYRIAVRRPEDNSRLLRALEEIAGTGGDHAG